jgi:DNA ligase 1
MALFQRVAQLAEAMAGTASRLKKRAAIAAELAALRAEEPAGEDAGRFAMYLAGAPFAEWDQRKLNAGGALLTRAVLAVCGATDAALSAAYRRHGDLGAAAFDLMVEAGGKEQPTGETVKDGPPHLAVHLSLEDVAEAFAAMAVARTTAARAELVEGLLSRATALEAKYLVKLMLGDMRIGVKQSLIEEAIAAAASVPAAPVSAAQVRHAVMLEADLGSALRRAFSGTLGEARMRLFHPLGFMLASPVDSPEQAIERFAGKGEARSQGEGEVDGVEQPRIESILEDKIEEKEIGEERIEKHKIEAFLEDKYDGMRAQVHCGDPEQPSRVAIYSRNREDITESFPELAEAFASVQPEAEGGLIFDGEILGWDFGLAAGAADGEGGGVTLAGPEAGHALPFAVLGQRIGRKRVSNEWRVRVPVVFMAFDLMVAAGALLLDLPLRERRSRLEAIVERLAGQVASPLKRDARALAAQGDLFAEAAEPRPAPRLMMPRLMMPRLMMPRLLLSPSRLVESAADIDRAYAAARARANEGVMIKAADSVYQPGRRGLAWVKLKRELATLDVVITGAEYGHGRRAGLLSDYTFAVRGPGYARTGELLNVGKAYSGVTDLEIAELTEWLKAHTLEDQGHFRTVEPRIVLEVAFNNIMRSARHASGFALRFPRILRLRPDKPVAEIDTVDRVEAIYQSQVDKPVGE